MTPAEIFGALTREGTMITLDGEQIRLRFKRGKAPPAPLIQAARENKAALRMIVATATARDASKKPGGISEQTGTWRLLIQLWGGTIGEAREVVNSVCAAAGAPGTQRRAHVGELFDKMKEQRRWV